MNVRMKTRDAVSDRKPRPERSARRGSDPKRRGDDRGRAKRRDGDPKRPRRSGEVATRPAKRDIARAAEQAPTSGAAQRAYERRQQRAVAVLGDAAPSATLPKRASSFAARIPFVATILGLLSVGLIVTLLLTTRSAEDSYQLGSAREHNEQLAQEKAALERDTEAGDSAPVLASRARDLGMIPAKDPARLLVGPDGAVAVIGKPAPAQGAPAPLLNAPSSQSGSITPNPLAQNGSIPPQTYPGTRATPQPGNGGQVQAQGEQLVPMTIPGQAAGGGAR